MSIVGVAIQQPSEYLDWDVDYTDFLGDDAISTVDVTVDPDGDLNAVVTHSPTVVKVWLSGGTNGGVYKVELTILTTGARQKQDEIQVYIEET
jgi:hypothetical protein